MDAKKKIRFRLIFPYQLGGLGELGALGGLRFDLQRVFEHPASVRPPRSPFDQNTTV